LNLSGKIRLTWSYPQLLSKRLNVIQADPTDNKYLACALEGEADYIVSGDRHLLDVGLYQGIKILKAKVFGASGKKSATPGIGF
jgi:predicted nucleic acid-binding protein